MSGTAKILSLCIRVLAQVLLFVLVGVLGARFTSTSISNFGFDKNASGEERRSEAREFEIHGTMQVFRIKVHQWKLNRRDT